MNRSFPEPERSAAPAWLPVSQGAALGLSLLMFMNLAELLVFAVPGNRTWFCEFRSLPPDFGLGLLAITATLMLMFSVRASLPFPIRMLGLLLLTTFALFCGIELRNEMLANSQITAAPGMFRPLSVMAIMAVAGFGIAGSAGQLTPHRISRVAIPIAAMLTFLGFVVASIENGTGHRVPPSGTAAALIVLPANSMPAAGELDDQLAQAATLLQNHPVDAIVLPGHGDATDSDALTRLADRLNCRPEQIVTMEPGRPFEALLAQIQSDRSRTSDGIQEDSIDGAEPEPPPTILVLCSATQRTRVRLIGQRLGVDVVCAAGEHDTDGQRIAILQEVPAMIRTMAMPCVNWLQQQLANRP